MEFVRPTVALDADISVDEIYTRIDTLFDAGWRDHLAELAECMVAFRTQRRAFRALLSSHAASMTDPKLQGAQSFLLRYTPRYGIRVNLWFPESGLARTNDRYRRYLSIDELHNHDFSFLTICLSGPGYTSDFYRDRNFSPDYVPGDRLDLASSGSLHLRGDAVLFVEGELDYHAQHWPDAFSTTLNLIPRDPHPRPTQYIVNRGDLSVREVIHGEPQEAEPRRAAA